MKVNIVQKGGYFRTITAEREIDIYKFYEQAALSMYEGFVQQMKNYEGNGDARQKAVAALSSGNTKKNIDRFINGNQ